MGNSTKDAILNFFSENTKVHLFKVFDNLITVTKFNKLLKLKPFQRIQRRCLSEH